MPTIDAVLSRRTNADGLQSTASAPSATPTNDLARAQIGGHYDHRIGSLLNNARYSKKKALETVTEETRENRASGDFHFEPITEGHIRLVTIASAKNQGDPLDLRITHHRLDEHLSYTAVSYTWGNIFATSPVRCNDKTLQVTSNCKAALLAARQAESSLTLWIDAVCINQGDPAERQHQVAIMGEIYRMAKETLVYLGESNDVLDIFDDAISDDIWRDLFRRPWFNRTWVIQELMLSRHVVVAVGQQRLPWLDLISLGLARGIELPALVDLRSDFVHEYGRRPPKSMTPDHTGDSHRNDNPRRSFDDGDDVLTAVEGMVREFVSVPVRRSGPHVDIIVNDTDSPTIGDLVVHTPSATSSQHSHTSVQKKFLRRTRTSRRVRQRESGYIGLHYWRILDILQKTRDFQCQDPRDKLFALLALFKKPIPPLLYPDYRKPVAAVYTDLSWFILQLDLPDALSNANGSTMSGLPSWVTDWRLPQTPRSISEKRHHQWRIGFQLGVREIRPLKTSDASNSGIIMRGLEAGVIDEWLKTCTYRLLIPLPGINRIETVQFTATVSALGLCSSRPRKSESRYGPAKHWKHCEGASVHLTCIWPTNVDATEDQSLRADADAILVRMWEALRPVQFEWPKQRENSAGHAGLRLQVTDGDLALDLFEIHLKQHFPGFKIDYSQHQPPKGEILIDYVPWLGGRWSSGRRLHVDAPGSLRAGDKVCILLGFQAPFVMRCIRKDLKGRKCWRLIAECHFEEDDVMEGHIVDNLDWALAWSYPAVAPLQDLVIH